MSGRYSDEWFRVTIIHTQAVRAFTNSRSILHYPTRITETSIWHSEELCIFGQCATRDSKAFHHSNLDEKMSQAASHGWPEPPHLAGRPIDTALLLTRDYRLQIDSRITSSPSAIAIIPSIVFISFSITIEALIDVLCDRVGITQATGDLLPNFRRRPVHQGRTGRKPRTCEVDF